MLIDEEIHVLQRREKPFLSSQVRTAIPLRQNSSPHGRGLSEKTSAMAKCNFSAVFFLCTCKRFPLFSYICRNAKRKRELWEDTFYILYLYAFGWL